MFDACVVEDDAPSREDDAWDVDEPSSTLDRLAIGVDVGSAVKLAVDVADEEDVGATRLLKEEGKEPELEAVPGVEVERAAEEEVGPATTDGS